MRGKRFDFWITKGPIKGTRAGILKLHATTALVEVLEVNPFTDERMRNTLSLEDLEKIPQQSTRKERQTSVVGQFGFPPPLAIKLPVVRSLGETWVMWETWCKCASGNPALIGQNLRSWAYSLLCLQECGA